MATKRTTTPPPAAAPARPPYMLIEQIQVKGYKSLVDATLHVRPLTLLAGTNSSGKSSIMQPLLLIKQTMEANYNPAGALVLSGAHVQAETAEELISKIDNNRQLIIDIKTIIKVEFDRVNYNLSLVYGLDKENFYIASQTAIRDGEQVSLTPQMSWQDVEKQLDSGLKSYLSRNKQPVSIQQVNRYTIC